MATVQGLTTPDINTFSRKSEEIIQDTYSHSFLTTFSLMDTNMSEEVGAGIRSNILQLQASILANSFEALEILVPLMKKAGDINSSEVARQKIGCLRSEFIACLKRFQRDSRKLLFMQEAYADQPKSDQLLNINSNSTSTMHRSSVASNLAFATNLKRRKKHEYSCGAVTSFIEDGVVKAYRIILSLRDESYAQAWSMENYTSCKFVSCSAANECKIVLATDSTQSHTQKKSHKAALTVGLCLALAVILIVVLLWILEII